MAKPNPRVYMDVSHGSAPLGRMVFELYADTTPRTAANFLALCTGSKGTVPYCRRPLAYKNSTFHRVIKGFMAQGGDFESGNGTGGASIYGKSFADENFTRRHISRGLLSMANSGPNTNGSQFFITFKATPFLNGKHVVFGRLVEGMRVLDAMEAAQTDRNDKPVRDLKITACGVAEDPAAAAAAAKAKEAKAAEEAKAAKAKVEAKAKAEAAAAAAAKTDKKSDGKSLSEAEAAAVAASEASYAAGGSWTTRDPSSLPPRERKLYELQQRMAAARAKNAGDTRAEAQRLNNPRPGQKGRGEIVVGEDGEVVAVRGKGRSGEKGAGKGGEGEGKGKGKGAKGDAAEEEEDAKLKYVDATLEDCEAWEAKQARKRAGAAAEGWEVHSMDTKYKTYEKRAATLPHTRDASAPAAAGQRPSAAQIDALVADLEAQEKTRNERRRKRHYESADMNYVNEANKTFVEKAAKHYDKFTAEVSSALERGSA